MTSIKKIFIHDSEFPSTNSNNILSGYLSSHPELDPAYITTLCGISRQETRNWLESLWEKYQPYAEPNFLSNLREKGGFHAFSWQMYLAAVLLDKNYQLKPNSGSGPDIQIIVDGKNCWIEAIVTTPGEDESAGGLLGSGKIYESLDPRVARISNSLTSKYRIYKDKYLDKCCKSDEPFIIAINGTNTQTMFGSRAIEATVYARGNDVMVKNPDGKFRDGKYELRERVVIKKDDKDVVIPTNYFCSDLFKELTGAIYCEQYIINANNFGRTPEKNLFFAINDYASNPVGNFSIGNVIERLSDGRIICKQL